MRSLGELTLYGVKLALVNHPVAVLVELRSVILQQLRSVATCGTMLQQAVSDCNMLSCGSHLRQHLLSRHLPVSVHVLDQALKLGLVAGDHLLHDSMVAMFLARLCCQPPAQPAGHCLQLGLVNRAVAVLVSHRDCLRCHLRL